MPRKGQFKSLLGKTFTTNEGEVVKVIKHEISSKCTIQYDDGTLYEDLCAYRLVKGGVRKPINRLGEVWKTITGDKVTIIGYDNWFNVTLQLEDGRTIPNCIYQHIKENNIKNPYYPDNYGVGYLGVGKYKNTINGKTTIQCTKWSGMFRRCYNEEERLKNPSYDKCSVDQRFHCLQDFGKWFDEKYDSETMQGWHLDKDILVKGNKIYSPETCCLVPVQINSLFVKSNKIRGKYPIGVSWNKECKKFVSNIKKNNELIPLGKFNTIEEAFQAYKIAKEAWIKEVADKWKPFIEERVYQAMYNYQVEITD